MIDFTTVVAVDAKTVAFAAHSIPTWRRNQPLLWKLPLVVLFDRRHFYDESLVALQELFDHPNAEFVPWPPDRAAKLEYETQRERMLSAFVYAPAVAPIETPYWCKIDLDSIALRPSPWPLSEWFEGNPVWVASPWGYTKPADQMARLDAWANEVDALQHFPALNLPVAAGAKRCVHKRMCSWLSFYRTEWSHGAAHIAAVSCGAYRIPVPSQDGYHWYVAARRGERGRHVSMKKFGWTNHCRLSRLKTAAAGILGKTHS